jgi:hypothetical protein
MGEDLKICHLPTSAILLPKHVAYTKFKPMVGWFTGESMVSIINNVIKNPTHGYQNDNVNKIMIFNGYAKMRESFLL